MGIKVGDKVRFLNDIGGGVVTAFKNKNVVLIDNEDGFEVPALIRECVIIEEGGQSSAAPSAPTSSTNQSSQEAEETYVYHEDEDPAGDTLKVMIALVPENPSDPTESPLEAYLINDSNYFCYYTINAFRGEQYFCEFNDLLEPNTKVFLDTFERSRLGWLTKGFTQIMAFKQGKNFTKQMLNEKAFEISAAKLSKPGVYQKNDFFDQPVFLLTLTKDLLEEKIEALSNKDFDEIKKEKVVLDQKPKSKKRERQEIVEVDLHINALLDDLTGLSNADILNYQMTRFRETVEEYKALKGQKIVFIHGIGNGTLKTELRKELDRKKMNFQDASFKEYGFGATMIVVR